MSLLRWWTIHPWLAWWTCCVVFGAGAALHRYVPRTGRFLVVVALICWAISFVQGLRVSWRRSPRRTALIVALVLIANVCMSTVLYPGDFAQLDTDMFMGFIVVGTIVGAAVIAEYGLQHINRRSNRPSGTE